jgi:uncharacterized protein (UPF0128 family)
MFSGYIELNKGNLRRNYQKFFVKTVDNKWFLVDKIFKDNSLELKNFNLKNVGIIKCFYLPKSIKSKNISYEDSNYWQSKVIYEDNDLYVFYEINNKIFNHEFINFRKNNNYIFI